MSFFCKLLTTACHTVWDGTHKTLTSVPHAEIMGLYIYIKLTQIDTLMKYTMEA